LPEGADDDIADGSYAMINKVTKVATQITKVDTHRYDIDLAGGTRFQGAATYHLQYHYGAETNEHHDMLISVTAWDQYITAQRITIITNEIISDDLSAEAFAKEYDIQTNSVGSVTFVKIYLSDGIHLGIRIEEDNIPDRTPRAILITKTRRDQST
jgi:hypothetical protein